MDVNLPKFTVEDLPLFRGITSDLFPGVELPTADHGALIPTIDEICWSGAVVAPGREYKLEPLGSFTLKIVQLYEMVLVRHGVMIVGQTLSGKTSAIHTLASAMTKCAERGEPFEKVNIHTMNPKSIKSGQLYGNFDENTQAAEAAGIAESCQADLDKAMPALEGAIAALKSLSKGDIVEIKAMKKPPDAVKLVMEAVCLMMAVKPDKIKDPNGGNKKIDDYWGPAQKNLLGDPRFLQHLMEYDRDNMAPAMVEKVITYTTKEQFQVDVVKKASIAAAGLCRWVSAMMIYDKVAKDVGPKKKALKEAEQSLKSAKEALEEKEATLAEVQKKLQTLQDQLDAANKKKGDLQTQVTDCATKLERAEQLIKGLGGEKVRWNELSEELAGKYENVTGDILLSSGVIAYLGAFQGRTRERNSQLQSLISRPFSTRFG